MALFKNRLGWIVVSIFIIFSLAIYRKPIRKVIHEKFQNPETTECVLDCTNKELMHAVKRQFETKYVEGFTNPNVEGFQDASQLLSLVQNTKGIPNLSSLGLPSGGLPLGGLPGLAQSTTPPNLGAFATNFLGASGLQVPSVPGFSTVVQPTQLSRNKLKTIRRALKIDDNRCEYNVVYDESKIKNDGSIDERKDVFGYIQATVGKEQGSGCTYKPVEVKLLIGPQIVRYDTANPDAIVPTIDYVF